MKNNIALLRPPVQHNIKYIDSKIYKIGNPVLVLIQGHHSARSLL